MKPSLSFKAKFEDKKIYNQKYAQFYFELINPHQIEFQAGQYLSLKVADIGERRSYSICSTPNIKHQLQILVDLSPAGLGSNFLNQLQYGQEVEFLAPLGKLIISDALMVDHLVFVATGSGITPFKAMIEDQLRNKQDQRPITLFWGMRFVQELFWLDELEELAQAFANFHFHPVISQAVEEWTLCRGHVTDCLSVHELPSNAAYFLCGNQKMIVGVKSLLTSKNIRSEFMMTEQFY